MEMGLNNLHDAQTVRCCISYVLVDVALWVDDSSKTCGGVAHHVARVGKTFEVVLLKKHIHHPLD